MTLNGEVGLKDCGKFQFAPSSVKSSTIYQHPGIHWYYCFWREREKIMIQFQSRLILTIIQRAKLDVRFSLMKEHRRMCVNLSVCGAQPSPMARLSGPPHPPCRWTWLSMQSHLLSAPWSWRKAVRPGGGISAASSPHRQVLILYLSQMQAGWYEATLTSSHRWRGGREEGKALECWNRHGGTEQRFSLADTKADTYRIRCGFAPKSTPTSSQSAHLFPPSASLVAGRQLISASLVGWLRFTTAQKKCK